jgi:hypothetical protein
MTTRTAQKPGLGRAIVAGNTPALMTPLRCVPRVYACDSATQSLGLVCKEARQLRERPGMQPTFGFATAGLHAGSDVREVFDDDDCTRRNARQDTLAENMVTVPSETLSASREESKTAFSRLGSFGLQLATPMETPMFHLTPGLLAVETVIGGDGRAADAQVNPKSLSVVRELHVIEFQNDVEGEPTFVIHQVGGGCPTPSKGQGVGRNGEGDLLPSCDSGEIDGPRLPIQCEGVQIEAGRTIGVAMKGNETFVDATLNLTTNNEELKKAFNSSSTIRVEIFHRLPSENQGTTEN